MSIRLAMIAGVRQVDVHNILLKMMITNLQVYIFLKILQKTNLDTKPLLRVGSIKMLYFIIDKFTKRCI